MVQVWPQKTEKHLAPHGALLAVRKGLFTFAVARMQKFFGPDLNKIGLIFFGIPFITYFFVFFTQYSKLQPSTEKIQILITRIAVFLPFYAFLIYLSLIGGNVLYFILQIPLAMMEAYSFYAFLVMVVHNVGGSNAVVNIMNEHKKPYFLPCCSGDYVTFYKQVHSAMYHFITTRIVTTIIQVILAIIAYKKGSKLANVASAIFALISFAILCRALGYFVTLLENLYSYTTNIGVVFKLIFLKFSVGIIVLQGLIEEFISSFDKSINYSDDLPYSDDFQALRVYCFLVLLQFTLLSPFYYCAYSSTIEASKSTNNNSSPTTITTSSSTPLTLCGFFCKVCDIRDIFGVLALDETRVNLLNNDKL
eukprot:gene14181-19030_t